jgi:LemA protein
MPDYLPFIIFAVAVPVLWFITTYNRFIKFKNMMEEGWSIIDVMLKRRANLIPKLIATVQGYSKHEADVLASVTEQRLDSDSHEAINKHENAVSKSLGGLLAVAEAYPDLKASGNFLELQKALSDVEDDIATARNKYNQRVRQMNILVQQFPSNLVARIFHFRREDYFTLELATEREVPEIPWS